MYKLPVQIKIVVECQFVWFGDLKWLVNQTKVYEFYFFGRNKAKIAIFYCNFCLKVKPILFDLCATTCPCIDFENLHSCLQWNLILKLCLQDLSFSYQNINKYGKKIKWTIQAPHGNCGFTMWNLWTPRIVHSRHKLKIFLHHAKSHFIPKMS